MNEHYIDRSEAGKLLAKNLSAYLERDDVIVLALPRGGVPVGFEVAKHLHVPLDLMLVRKLGMPGQEELALGAIALPDICVFNHDIVSQAFIAQGRIDKLIAEERKELLRRNQIYRGGEPQPNLKDKVVILVDDGMATGADMRAAVSAVAQQQPLRTVVAVPVSSQQAYENLRQFADEVLCLRVPLNFYSVGRAYRDFSQITDSEVIALLEQAKHWGHGQVHFDRGARTVTNFLRRR